MAVEKAGSGDVAAVEAAKSSIKANMAVLYAAQSSTTSQEDMMAMLSSGKATEQILNTMSSDPGTGLAQAATAYGMYYAYKQTKGETVSENAVEVLKSFESDTEFQNWLKNDSQAEKDMAGYYAAMDMISTSANGNAEAVTDILMNGYGSSNEDLHTLLNSILATNSQ